MTQYELDQIKLRFRAAVTLTTPEYQTRTGQLSGYAQQAILLSWGDIPALLGWLKEVESDK